MVAPYKFDDMQLARSLSRNQQKQTIAHLNKKCNECENEKSELEIKCGNQDATITNLNTNVRDLELTIVQLTEKLGDQENEIENLKKENLTLQDNQNKLKNNLEDRNNTELMKLRIQYDDEKKQYETKYAFMLDEKDRQIQHISEDKDKQIKDLADEKEKLTDLIKSNNTSISRQQQEELNRKININLMSLKEYQLKLAACENDIRIQNMQFLECQEALQKCKDDKLSEKEEYNNLLVSQNHYVQECQQKLLDCENSKQIKYDEYNTLNVIRKFPSDNIHEILALQQQNDLHVKTLQEENETITSNLLTIQQTNASLQDSNKQMLSELSETRMHLSMINHDETSVDPIEYEETQMNKFTLIIQAVTTQLDAYLAGTCNNKYLRSAFEKLSMRKMFCKNEMAKSEMMQLFISLSNHIFKFIFCAQFYKNLVTLSQKYIYYENEHELLINHIHRKGSGPVNMDGSVK
nr:myosin-6-like [Procambarus clarkii]